MKKAFLILPLLAILNGELFIGWFNITYSINFKK